ncbi:MULTISPECIES: TetR/AcrR family transcriptional regulator [unclassified Agromyces]|uniref:TetR/AcrR family transcriptional regulator n=1 Tax=unclassified Agromyces TaxID=2639701 RepID=UPI0030147166
MDLRDRILDETRRLTLQHGVIPSLNAVAEATRVSKGGLMHHFPTRAALVEGLARRALDEVDRAMVAAAAEGRAAATWLALSVPSGDDLDLFRAMAIAHRALEQPGARVLAAASEAVARWERLIADEVGDPVRARVIRLVGDGLAGNALAGLDEPAARGEGLRALLEHLGVADRQP